MKIKCKFCDEMVAEENMRAHVLAQGSSCRAALETSKFIADGFRPLPETCSVPEWVRTAYQWRTTRGPYEGEPRGIQRMLGTPVRQLWVPRWLDNIIELWSGPIYTEGDVKRAQRDACIDHVKINFTSSMKLALGEARNEDVRAVREYLKRWQAFVGDQPMLLSEFEKLGRFEDPRYRR